MKEAMHIISKIEDLFQRFEQSEEKERKELRRNFRGYIQEYAGIDQNNTISLAETIASIANLKKNKKFRDIAMITLQALSINGLFRSNDVDGKLISLFDKYTPDIYQRYDLSMLDQTYEKIEVLSKIHTDVCEKLYSLVNVDPSIDSVLLSRKLIFRSLQDSLVKSYTSHLGSSVIVKNLEKIFSLVNFYKDDKETFFDNYSSIIDNIEKELSYCDTHKSFLTNNYYKILLTSIKSALKNEKLKVANEFSCSITTIDKLPIVNIDKKYPLHLIDKKVHLEIPFQIIGNGIAKNVRGEISTDDDNVIINNSKFIYGDIKSRFFTVSFDILVVKPLNMITIDVFVEWGVIAKNDDQQDLFEFKFHKQNPDIDWDHLSDIDPYSLEVVSGNDFIGRKDIVRRIWKRLASSTVTSSYITGQKRVGKSSLANAIVEYGETSNKNYKFISFEYGEYGNKDAEKTLNFLGELLIEELKYDLPPREIENYNDINLDGSLSILVKLVRRLETACYDNKYVIILDEFDEINHELYRLGQLADTFFSNLRALSSKKNIGFLLVGSERMEKIMGAQGDQLNKFSPESLDSFDIVNELKDYEDLIRKPVNGFIEWHDDAIRFIYNQTTGHPYFTNLICSHMVERSIMLKDCEITSNEIETCLDDIVFKLGVNSFSHFWKDGIDGDHEEQLVIELKRCRVLVGFAQAYRLKGTTDLESIYQKLPSTRKMSEDEVNLILQQFCSRQIMELDTDCNYRIKIKLFEKWLIEKGVNIIIIDQLADEIEDAQKRVQEDAYVKSSEISELTKQWPLYRGQKITSEDVRSWLQQESKPTDQRILFTLLQNIRFPNELEINDMLALAHDSFKKDFVGFVQKDKRNRRADLLVTYVDGIGKSGSYYSTRYCQKNKLSSTSNYELGVINKELNRRKGNTDLLRGLIIVDDFIGTGNSMSENLNHFIDENEDILHELSIPIRIIVLFSTKEGEKNIRASLLQLKYSNIDLFICEIIDQKHYAFTKSLNFWVSEENKNYAKALCTKHGSRLSKQAPLGFKNQGMLFVLPRNCPNNSLTLIHKASHKNVYSWNALFPRIKGK